MAATIAPTPPPVRDETSIYRFGWRDVPRRGPDGSMTVEREPLTLEDLLHPQWGDVILQNTVHDNDCHYLKGQFQARLANRPGVLILHDCQLVWDDPALGKPAPDISVIFDVREPGRPRGQFDVAKEGVRPTMLVEVVSPDSRTNDVDVKVGEYHQARVPWYIIVDRQRDEGPVNLLGYRWAPEGYKPIPLTKEGRLLLEPVNMILGTRDNRVVLYDARTGEELLDLEAEAKLRKAAEAKQEAEAAARRAAEAKTDELQRRLKELEDQLRRSNGNGSKN